jgi:ELWxxDGT repeat protein
LFRTDGTTAGTIRLSFGHGDLGGFAKFNGYVYFNGRDLATGMPGLYRTDGTETGTAFVTPVNIENLPSQMFANNTDEWLIFAAVDSTHGQEVWRSDGTAAGTQMIEDMFPGTEGSFPAAFTRFGAEVYFVARTAEADFGVWATDGTNVRLVRRVTLITGIEIQATPNAAYFTGDDVIYISDGTSAGTRALTARPGKTYHSPELLTATPLGLFFTANDGQLTGRPFSTDGTVALRLGENVGTTSPPIGVANGPGAGVYVISSDGVTGQELWLQRK